MGISVDQKHDLFGSVVRALRILDVVAAHPRGLTPKAISLKLDLHLSTCYHLVNTLVATGFLQRRPDTQAYVLSAKIAHLNSAFLEALEVLPVLQAHAQTLHDTTGETCTVRKRHPQSMHMILTRWCSATSGLMVTNARYCGYTSLDGIFAQYTFAQPADAPIVTLLQRHAAHATGQERRVYGDTPWMDAAFASAAGMPTVVFGPGGASAHAVEEWADLPSVEQCADVLLAVATEFCA